MEKAELKVYAKKAKPITVHEKLPIELKKLFENDLGIEWKEEWREDLPKKWKVTEDLLILPWGCFCSEHWRRGEAKLWETVAKCFKVKRVARENKVKSDDFRTPNFTLLLGQDSLVTVCNNGIKYCYDVCKCMFSWGNITEKLRIASFDCSNETVVDLFAGIGYFTLVYLVHAKAKRVVACEWNPDAVKALRHNLALNKCEDRCEVLEGDNRKTCPVNFADRVNLGLIPSSELSWEVACNALRIETGGYLHIHANVDIKKCTTQKEKPKLDWDEWANYAKNKIKQILDKRDEKFAWNVTIKHIEYVKSYGPRVDHLVLDLECRPDILTC